MAILTTPAEVKRVLETHKTVAVLGAHATGSKAAHYVPKYLHDNGYDIYPVNPVFAGEQLFGREVVAELKELTEPVDIVDVFRRSEHLPEHLNAILSLEPLPKLVWLQLGIRHDEVAQQLSGAGIDVIQNRCMLADHQQLL